MSRIFMPIGDGSETLDTFYALHRLQEAGFTVDVAGPEARLYHTVMHEFPPGEPKWDITREAAGYHLRAHVAFRETDADRYAGMFVSGGRAPEYLRYDEDLLRITREIFAAEKPVASLCHGIEILTAADVIRGRTVTTVPKCALDAKQGGAEYVDQTSVVDGNLVTARTYNDNAPLLARFAAVLDHLKAREPGVTHASVLAGSWANEPRRRSRNTKRRGSGRRCLSGRHPAWAERRARPRQHRAAPGVPRSVRPPTSP